VRVRADRGNNLWARTAPGYGQIGFANFGKPGRYTSFAKDLYEYY
jgi:hypothetical protein